MNVAVVGGGPAGLYCGLLLKKTSPATEVTVFERYPPDTTYGWGLVFSERTLGVLHEADVPSARAITERFILWESLDIRHRNQRVRYDGQVFAGIARRALLTILRQRCEELGVGLRFGTAVADMSALAWADVIVGADGAESAVRDAHASAFRPRVEEGATRYIWLGELRVRDAYTMAFRQNEHGLFGTHAYPYDQATNAFIVECSTSTWQRAGLGAAGEDESIAYCERLFREELEGARLLSNGSRWTTFRTLTCARWSHRNIVLVGDAAHTAHFSIGSGAKLAMEDGVALARALAAHRDVEHAFQEYEAERRPVVEAVQHSARESQAYFEQLPHYLKLEPVQFAFHLLTRNGWASYDSLRVRDPGFVDVVNRWFASSAVSQGASDSPAPAPMLTPLRVRGLDLANRIVMLARPSEGSWAGVPSEADQAAFGGLAVLGAGLVATEPLAVSPEGRVAPAGPCLWDDTHAGAWARSVRAVHEHSHTRVAVYLTHAGPRGSRLSAPLISASPLSYTTGSPVPREATREDMDRVREAFVEAARRAQAIGADMLAVHAGWGYLLGCFVSPLTNRRTDSYGGTIEARMRFPLEVVAAVRAAWPDDRPLAVACTVDDSAEGGLDPGDAVAAARMFKERGVDVLHVLAGQTVAGSPPVQGGRRLTALCDRVRNEAGILVLASGFLTTTDQINSVLAAGRADLCAVETTAALIL